MKIVETYSHFNGLEYLLIHKPALWQEIYDTIHTVHAEACTRQTLQAERKCYNPHAIYAELKRLFCQHHWQEKHVSFTGLMKERIALELQFDKNIPTAPEIFATHLALYVSDHIDVGIEILPMKSLQDQMSSGVAYYEGGLYNVIRQGRGVPSVPLVMIGIAP